MSATASLWSYWNFRPRLAEYLPNDGPVERHCVELKRWVLVGIGIAAHYPQEWTSGISATTKVKTHCEAVLLSRYAMPTVPDIPGPYRFFFYSFDCHEPPHVQVRRERMV